MTFKRVSHIRRPLTVTNSVDASDVAEAYNYPPYTGAGYTCAIIELGGGFRTSDLSRYFRGRGLPTPEVTAVSVDGVGNAPGDKSGADEEVLLDIQVAGGVAPGGTFRVYFAPNTDAGFLHAVEKVIDDKVKGVDPNIAAMSISWGGAEPEWEPKSMDAFNKAFLNARKAGIVVFCAAGDTGSGDSEPDGLPHVDFPASSPNVIGCGGTRLTLDQNGQRETEVTWNDSPTTSATGGGVSQQFPSRQVPDVAGNADPATGYRVVVNGRSIVIGGTSAVVPLYAGLVLRLSEAVGKPVGEKVDLMNTLLTNLGVFFDVTAGDNGAYRAGLGRDNTTGLGVVDGYKLLAVLTDDIVDPLPIGDGAPVPEPTPGASDAQLAIAAHVWLAKLKPWSSKSSKAFAVALVRWLNDRKL